jgi:hypothetical protein
VWVLEADLVDHMLDLDIASASILVDRRRVALEQCGDVSV